MYFPEKLDKNWGHHSLLSLYIFSILLVSYGCKQSRYLANTSNQQLSYELGAIVRANSLKKELCLVFTGDEFADGAKHITSVLNKQKLKAAFFFYRKLLWKS